MLAVLSLALLLAGAEKSAIPWRVDAPQALTDAETKGQPVLLQFRTKCGTEKSDCDLMQQVWSDPQVAAAAQRFVPVLAGEGGEGTLNVQYDVVKPTTVLADPWGNEIVKLVGHVPRDRMLSLLQAVPKDFSPLRGTGLALRENREHFSALLSAASFYESQGLREFAEQYYARTETSTDRLADKTKRRLAVISRGTNLMKMGKHAEAADLFGRTLKKAPNGPMSDALLLGQVMAESQQGHKLEAERAFAELKQRFPDSPYVAKAREQFP
jgi:tetratricopeptide (TPR) repeat protein